MPIAHSQNSFTAGRLSRLLHARPDLQKYHNGCEVLTNWLVYPQGGAYTVPGTKYIATAKDTTAIRLVPFIYSDSDAYVLEFGNLYIRFFREEAQIMDPGVPSNPYEIVTPYTTAQLSHLQFTPSGDVVYIACPDHPPYKLSRLDHASWTIAELSIQDGPYLPENIDGETHIRASATTGSVTLRAEKLYQYTSAGTWTGTPAAAAAVFDGTTNYMGLTFTNGSYVSRLSSIKINIVAAPGVGPPANPGTAYLYSNNAGSPGTLLETSTNTPDCDTTGDKTFTFAGTYDMAASTAYWIVVGVGTPDVAFTANAVTSASVPGFGSGKHSTITSITDSLAYEWKMEIIYQTMENGDVWASTNVGSKWRLKHSGDSTATSFTAADITSSVKKLYGKFHVDIEPIIPTGGGDYWSGRIILQKSVNQVTWYDVASFFYAEKQQFFESETGVYYRLLCKDYVQGTATATIYQDEHWGCAQITAVTNAYTCTATVLADFRSTDPTPFWREGAWSPRRGYPGVVEVRHNRLLFGATDYQPTTMWGSWVGDWENHMPGDTDDAPVDYTIGESSNRFVWFKNLKALVAGSIGEEIAISGDASKPITPDTINANSQTTYGSAVAMSPVRAGPALLFVQQGRRKVRELVYDYGTDQYVAPDLTELAEDITSGGIIGMWYQQEPHSILWCVRSDGKLTALTYNRENEVVAWSLIDYGGIVRSGCAIPSSISTTESHDQNWIAVSRTIRGGTYQYIEVQKNNEIVTEQDEYWSVASGLEYEGAAATTLTGLGHLERETVAVYANSEYVGTQTVQTGTVTLTNAATYAIVGLPYTCTLRPVRPEVNAPEGGTSAAKIKAYTEVVLRVKDCLGGKIGPNTTDLQELSTYVADSQVMDTVPVPFTGDITIRNLSRSCPDGQPYIVQDKPVPMQLLSIITSIDVGE